MKGGISSGLVYPRAVCRLATHTRFRRLGGTSAGAMAAAAAAAAEFGRDRDGFVKLHALPEELGADLAGLFLPSDETRTAFNVMMDWLEPDWGRLRKLLSSARRAVAGSPPAFVIAAGVLLLPLALVWLAVAGSVGSGLGWVALGAASLIWCLVAVVAGVLSAFVTTARRTLAALPARGYGLCDGHSSGSAGAVPPLTDWLADRIQHLAGLEKGGPPLTIGMLWGQPAVDRYLELRQASRVPPEDWDAAVSQRVIDLEVMTTNVTLGRPYRIPFSERLFYFCERRMRTYFPDPVVDHMVATTEAAKDKDDGPDAHAMSMRCPCHGEPVRSFPEAPDVPVVVASRLSLSFPILLSAVPLLCVDYGRTAGKRGLIEVWFSDGGISSNFPMHLFDAALPTRPTYGFNLSPSHPDYPDPVWKPSKQGASGRLPRPQEITTVVSFLRAVLGSMQNWSDNTRITMPGFRDRVAVIRQRPGEGGMNLRMDPSVIRDLADRGAQAAALFDEFDIDLHKWVRYRTTMPATDELLSSLLVRYDSQYADFIESYGATTTSFKPSSAAKDEKATEQVMDAARTLVAMGHPHRAGVVPRPMPELRVQPRM